MDCTTIEFFNTLIIEIGKIMEHFNFGIEIYIHLCYIRYIRGENYVSKNHELWLLGY